LSGLRQLNSHLTGVTGYTGVVEVVAEHAGTWYLYAYCLRDQFIVYLFLGPF
jgi:hypothetical protein